MLAGLAFGSEIKRFGRSRMTRVAIVVLMLLPLVYGALYLWAFWDPFGHVNKMPVALVNSDRGAVVSGQQFNAGAEIAKSLTADGSLDWHVVSPADARNGVDHGKYYFMVELPPDFSAAIASPVTGQPEEGQPDRRLQRCQQLHLDKHRPHRHQPGTQRRVVAHLRPSGQSDAVRGGFVRLWDQTGRRRRRPTRLTAPVNCWPVWTPPGPVRRRWPPARKQLSDGINRPPTRCSR